jgi:predicted AAA+ superfamily ATPase
MPEHLIARRARGSVLTALADTRVVLVLGARQVGKSTLCASIAADEHPATVFTLDDRATRDAAAADPTGFVAGLPERVVIDEIQRVPDLVLAVKEAADRDPTPGRFLLTGSANLLTNHRVRDSLAGRAETIRLWPLAQAEIHGDGGNLVATLLAGEVPQITGAVVGLDAFVEAVAAGGYPAVRARQPSRRTAWLRDYVEAIVERDIRDIASAQKAGEIPRLLRLLAAQAANLLEYRKLARDLDLDDKTAKAYVKLLEDVFLVRVIRPWRPGLGKREVHAPKPYVVDSALMAYLLGANHERIADDDQVTGKLVESFCGMELLKHLELCDDRPELFHYRNGRDEIDAVIEDRSGNLACVEVKAAATVTPKDHHAMGKLRDARPGSFKAGIVLYTGAQTVPLGDRLWAVPISALWQSGAAR